MRNDRNGNCRRDEIMMDPSDIRSIYAKNDPAQRKSGNIMAGFAGLGITGLTARQMMGEDNTREEF